MCMLKGDSVGIVSKPHIIQISYADLELNNEIAGDKICGFHKD